MKTHTRNPFARILAAGWTNLARSSRLPQLRDTSAYLTQRYSSSERNPPG